MRPLQLTACLSAAGTPSARRRRKRAASAPKRPPTSTPTTTKRQRRARASSGYVCCRLRRAAASTAWPGRTSAPGCASPLRVTGLTMVASTASCAPFHRDKPLATTSMRRASAMGTSTFISARRTLWHTRPPASRHTGQPRAQAATHEGPVVPQAIQMAVAAADARRQLQREPQAAQEQHPELGRRDEELRGSRPYWARPACGPACDSNSARDAV